MISLAFYLVISVVFPSSPDFSSLKLNISEAVNRELPKEKILPFKIFAIILALFIYISDYHSFEKPNFTLIPQSSFSHIFNFFKVKQDKIIKLSSGFLEPNDKNEKEEA